MSHRVEDDRGVVLDLAGVPQRIVSLVPSLTELVCALGAGDRLVGVTRYCTDPRDALGQLPRLGGTKDPDCEAILALRPDVVLLNSEENRREDFERLRAGETPVFVSFPTNVREVARSVERVGVLLDTVEAARQIARTIDLERGRVLGTCSRRVRVFCPIWRNPWMSFNKATYAHDVLSCAGGNNVCADFPARYPVLDLAAVAALSPQVILLPDEPYPFQESHIASLQALSDTPAWREERIHQIDGKALCWYGPRTAGALRYLAELLKTSSIT